MKVYTLTYKLLLLFIVLGFSACKEADSPLEEEEETNPETEFQGEIDYVKTYGGSDLDEAVSIALADDGNYVILGSTKSTDGDIIDKSSSDLDYWLLKIAPDGEIIWSKTYGGPADDKASSLEKTTDGGFIASGYSRGAGGDVSGNAGFHDFWVVKFNASGDLEWEKSFGFPGSDKAYSAKQTKDGGYVVAGVLDVTASNGDGGLGSRNTLHAGGDYWLIKLSASGDLQWRNYFGGTFTDTAYDVFQTTSGDYLLLGTSDSFDVDISNNIGTYDFWVVKVAQTGEMIWEKNYGGTQIENLYAGAKTNDGNFFLFGDTRSDDGDVTSKYGNADIWGAKIDEDGNLIMQQSYGGTEFETAQHVTSLSNGTYLITGNARSKDGDFTINNGQNDALAMVIDENESLQFQITVGGSEFDFSRDAIEDNDNALVIAGSTQSNDKDIPENKGVEDVLIIKLK